LRKVAALGNQAAPRLQSKSREWWNLQKQENEAVATSFASSQYDEDEDDRYGSDSAYDAD